ncbi:MAG: GAF domain-containing protein, partial [Bacteroidota bacterium]
MNYPLAFHTLNQFSRSISQIDQLDQLLWYITDTCTRFLHLEDFVIYIRKEKENALVQSAAFGQKCGANQSILNPLQIPIGQGIVGLSALTQEAQKVDDTRQNDHYLIDDQQRLSELAVPIIWNNKVIGVIDSEHRHPAYFSTIYVDIFCLIATLCAPIIDQLQRKEKKKISTENKYYDQLVQLLEKEKIYRDKYLSLNSVAQRLQISPIYLSKIV